MKTGEREWKTSNPNRCEAITGSLTESNWRWGASPLASTKIVDSESTDRSWERRTAASYVPRDVSASSCHHRRGISSCRVSVQPLFLPAIPLRHTPDLPLALLLLGSLLKHFEHSVIRILDGLDDLPQPALEGLRFRRVSALEPVATGIIGIVTVNFHHIFHVLVVPDHHG